jgi:Zn-dependent peptidase ImmA (M78 family)/DNA-binding XRE family transcriptional regulator
MMDEKEIFAKRLKQARLKQKLTMEALGAGLRIPISKQAISRMEHAKLFPSGATLGEIARVLRTTVDELTQPFDFDTEKMVMSFRKKASLLKIEEKSLKVRTMETIESYLEVEELLGRLPIAIRKTDTVISTDEQMEERARAIRQKWNLGNAPIGNVDNLLTDKGIEVIMLEGPEGFDGVSGVVNGNHYVIVLNSNVKHSERQRLTCLHEAAHLLFNECMDKSLSEYNKEKLCNVFASEMLLPTEVLRAKFAENRNITMAELINLQQVYGISIDAIVYKLHKMGIVTDRRYILYMKRRNSQPKYMEMVQKSRYEENHIDRFSPMVYQALARDLISEGKAAQLLGCSVRVLNNNKFLI